MKFINRWIFFFLIFIPQFQIFAQQFNIDSLHLQFEKSENDSSRIKILNLLMDSAINSDTSLAKSYSSTLINELKLCENKYEKAEGFRTLGIYYHNSSNFESALQNFYKSISLFDSLKTNKAQIGKSKSLLQIGYLYHLNGDFTTAIEYYLDAESLLIDNKDNSTLLKIYVNLSDIQLKLNRFDKALTYMKRGVDLSNLIDNPSVKADYYNSYGNMYIYENNYEKAKELLDVARQIGLKNKLYKHLSKTEYNHAYILSREEKYLEAQEYYTKALEYSKKSGNKFDICDAMYKIAFMSYYMEDFEKASRILLQALDYADNIKSKILKRNILDVLLYLEAQRGNYKSAYEYLQMYVDVIYEIFSEDDQKQTNFLNAKYEAAKKEHEISKLLGEKQIQLLELERRNNLISLLVVIAISVFIILLLVRQYYQNRKKLTEQNLLLKEQKLKELEKEKQFVAVQSALRGEENERFRIARELHDGLGGLLSAAKMTLNSYRDNKNINSDTEDLFGKALSLLDTSINELRRVARNMMPQTLLNSGLKEALSEFCNSMDNKDQLKINFRFYGKEKRLPQNYELSLFRITQELINNLVKHSRATEANIQLVQEESRVSLTVQDNGIGFNKTEINSFKGYGLNNVKVRVESLNGHLEIDSSIGSGTEINIVFENLKSE